FSCSSFLLLRLSLFSFFFFSSRRRHTRSKRDWSSDVCSSALLSVSSFSFPAVPDGDTPDSGAPDTFSFHKETSVPHTSPRPPWRSEERRVGKEGRSRLWLYCEKNDSTEVCIYEVRVWLVVL